MKKQVLMPLYMKSFACIGSDCEDTCCAGWGISIDKKTYKKYKNVKHPTLTNLLNKGIKRIKDERASDSTYASFKLNKQSYACPMLDENKLCRIQLNLGENMLCSTCTTYPRVINKVDNVMELSAKLSCPEVSRLALLNPNGIEFEELEYEVNPDWGCRSRLNTLQPRFAEQLFWELRMFSIEIIQNRNLKISDRLIFLGIFINKVQQNIDNNQLESILSLVEEYRTKMNHPDYMRSLEQISVSTSFQVRSIIEMIQIRNQMGIINERYLKCLNEMLQGLGIDSEQGDVDLKRIETEYLNNYQNYYYPFIEQHEYILENYVVNYIYETLFPDMSSNKIFESYIQICILFSVLKIHMIGISGYHKGLTPEHVVFVIQNFSRVIEHNLQYVNRMTKLFEENGYNTLAHLATLVKDKRMQP
ncbi:flagellin lysine-N-methylase [Paenibacillus sp. ACRRX]|uniref:flagellin lysine-N-methylase n=1 Tax=Paenibacillus sp. ACRRX TaxID=2918206 RepID=UPI001EF6EE23|nr:flagellin lysine-N-methylase [Paenibacillus sp. ACRRX]MCG7407979.1 flagellin lysine-N-methylase [Paenibacillus sp. ACRRX]